MPTTTNNISSHTNPFTLTVGNLPADTFSVLNWQCADQTFNHDYQITVHIRSSEIDLSQLLKQPAYITLPENNYLHGIVTHTKQQTQLARGKCLFDTLTLCSPLHLLALTQRSAIYHDVDLPELITKLLKNHGWQAKQDFILDLKDCYPKRAYIAQYQETDLAFLQRLCAMWGVHFTFIQQTEKALLLFSDDITATAEHFNKLTLPFVFTSAMASEQYSIQAITVKQKVLTQTIQLNDYHHLTPNTSLYLAQQNKSCIPSFGLDYRHYEHYENTEEGKQLLKIRQQAIDSKRELFTATTHCPALQPGCLIEITDHPLQNFNGQFHVTNLQQTANETTLTFIRAYLAYRPTAISSPYMPDALANTTNDFVDNNGCYTIQPKFNQFTDTNSYPVRLLQPYSGNNYGMHFPLPKETEVLIGHVNGDANRPIILGMLPNTNTLSPSTSANKTQHVLRSSSGHQLVMDDQENEEHILLNTPDELLALQMNAAPNASQIALRTEQGNMLLNAGKTFTQQTNAALLQTVGNNHLVKAQQQYQLETTAGDIVLQAGQNVFSNAWQNLLLNTQQNILLNSQQNTVFNSAQNTVLTNQKNATDISAPNGNIVANASQHLQIKAGNTLTLSQAGSSVILSGGSITINAQTVNFNCSQLGAPQPQYSGGSGNSPSENVHKKNIVINFLDDAKRIISDDMGNSAYKITS